ncbi:MAG: hypothetical protein H0W25_04315 [Acidimicrobiia bacterium]|nr:hypothetical protein [Acidimicrobiia bacterium]
MVGELPSGDSADVGITGPNGESLRSVVDQGESASMSIRRELNRYDGTPGSNHHPRKEFEGRITRRNDTL